MFDLLRPRCQCGGRIRKVEFYLDPYRRWDHYYCCNSCGAHGDTVEACRALVPPPHTSVATTRPEVPKAGQG